MPSFLSGVAVDIVISVAGFLFSLLTYATALETFRSIKRHISDISKLSILGITFAVTLAQLLISISALLEVKGIAHLDINSMFKTAEELFSNDAFVYAAIATAVISVAISFYSFYSARRKRWRAPRSGAS